MTVWPDAKLNLGLNVLRKRPDGYHDIETLFVHYPALKDRLDIEPAEKTEISIDRCSWDPEKDLTLKAYRLLKEDFDLPPVRITLCKGIPVGAGLGGGSSDAAWTLRALNGLFRLGLSSETLGSYASRLGSDCAFFIYDTPMLGTGRGEILAPYQLDLGAYEIRVEVPSGVAVSTAEAYGGVKLHCGEPLSEVLKAPVEQWKGRLRNSFEETVFAAHPQIAAIKDRFYACGAVYASMSGSGSSVFGIFKK